MDRNKQEIILLAGLYIEGLRWLARDGERGKPTGNLCGFREKPHKESYLGHKGEQYIYWDEPQCRNRFETSFDGLMDHACPEISQEDIEPTNIGELLSKKILDELCGCSAEGKSIQNLFDR